MKSAHCRARQSARPHILVVDDEPTLHGVFREKIVPAMPCEMLTASTAAEARAAIGAGAVDLLATDLLLPDGSGTALVEQLRAARPDAAAIVVTAVHNVDALVRVVRSGAVDIITKPFSPEELLARVSVALQQQRQRAALYRRLSAMRSTIRRLKAARQIVSRKVDLLCNDLIGAYSDLSRQFDSIRLQEGYRQFIDRATGLEQLLCNTMDWLLRQVGYCNIGIWLASSDTDLQLGAYMKYTVAARQEMNEALQRNLLSVCRRRGFVRLRGADLEAYLTPAEMKFLAGQDLIGMNCTYLGETLAVMLLFRDSRTPFCDEDVAAARAVAPLFAVSLARAVKGADLPPDDADRPSPPESQDPADWWKHGESPPF